MTNERILSCNNGDEHVNEFTERLFNSLDNGLTLKDSFGLTNQMMDDLYKVAFDCYERDKLNDAETLFRFLCIYDFYNPEYTMGLAAVYQLKKNYPKAIDFYALSYLQSTGDYRPMFYAGQCNVLLGRLDYAHKCFDLVIKNSSDKDLTDRASAYMLILNCDDLDTSDDQSKE